MSPTETPYQMQSANAKCYASIPIVASSRHSPLAQPYLHKQPLRVFLPTFVGTIRALEPGAFR